MLLNDAVAKKMHDQFKILAMSQGHEIEDSPDDLGDDDLPPELLAKERELAERRKNEPVTDELEPLGFGYARV